MRGGDSRPCDARVRPRRQQAEETAEGVTRTFHYDPTGQRLRKTNGGAETRYQYDGASLLAESNAIGNLLSAYHYSATQLLSRTEAGSGWCPFFGPLESLGFG